MSNKWLLQGVQREGFDGVWRAGRFWPSNRAVEVEVLEQEEEPTVEVEGRDGKRIAPDPARMTAKAFASIMKDGRITKLPVGGAEPGGPSKEDLLAATRRIAELERLLAAAEARVADQAALIKQLEAELAGKQAESEAPRAAAPPPDEAPTPAPAITGDPEDLPTPSHGTKKPHRK